MMQADFAGHSRIRELAGYLQKVTVSLRNPMVLKLRHQSSVVARGKLADKY
jgi:hypothetical protein